MYLLEKENPNAPVRSNGKRGWYYATRNKPIRGIVIHTPQALGITVAEDLTAEEVAAYFAIVSRPASAHANIDSDSIVDLLPDSFTAFHAAGVNSETLGVETGWNYDSWTRYPERTEAVIERLVKWAAPKCVAYDIPPVRVTLKADWDNGARGFLEHSVTEGWRGQAGRRRDPGEDFPWTVFFSYLTDALNGDTMNPLNNDEKAAIDRLTAAGIFTTYTTDDPAELDAPMKLRTLAVILDRLYTRTNTASIPGISSGSGVTVTGEGFTIAGTITEGTR